MLGICISLVWTIQVCLSQPIHDLINLRTNYLSASGADAVAVVIAVVVVAVPPTSDTSCWLLALSISACPCFPIAGC